VSDDSDDADSLILRCYIVKHNCVYYTVLIF